MNSSGEPTAEDQASNESKTSVEAQFNKLLQIPTGDYSFLPYIVILLACASYLALW